MGNNQYDRDFKSPIYRIVNTTDIVTVVPLLVMGYVHIGDVRFLEPGMGDIRRGIPILQSIFFFSMAIFRWFGPLVGDHSIALNTERNLKLWRRIETWNCITMQAQGGSSETQKRQPSS